jgi:hypothetical protein
MPLRCYSGRCRPQRCRAATRRGPQVYCPDSRPFARHHSSGFPGTSRRHPRPQAAVGTTLSGMIGLALAYGEACGVQRSQPWMTSGSCGVAMGVPSSYWVRGDYSGAHLTCCRLTAFRAMRRVAQVRYISRSPAIAPIVRTQATPPARRNASRRSRTSRCTSSSNDSTTRVGLSLAESLGLAS